MMAASGDTPSRASFIISTSLHFSIRTFLQLMSDEHQRSHAHKPTFNDFYIS